MQGSLGNVKAKLRRQSRSVNSSKERTGSQTKNVRVQMHVRVRRAGYGIVKQPNEGSKEQTDKS